MFKHSDTSWFSDNKYIDDFNDKVRYLQLSNNTYYTTIPFDTIYSNMLKNEKAQSTLTKYIHEYNVIKEKMRMEEINDPDAQTVTIYTQLHNTKTMMTFIISGMLDILKDKQANTDTNISKDEWDTIHGPERINTYENVVGGVKVKYIDCILEVLANAPKINDIFETEKSFYQEMIYLKNKISNMETKCNLPNNTNAEANAEANAKAIIEIMMEPSNFNERFCPDKLLPVVYGLESAITDYYAILSMFSPVRETESCSSKEKSERNRIIVYAGCAHIQFYASVLAKWGKSLCRVNINDQDKKIIKTQQELDSIENKLRIEKISLNIRQSFVTDLDKNSTRRLQINKKLEEYKLYYDKLIKKQTEALKEIVQYNKTRQLHKKTNIDLSNNTQSNGESKINTVSDIISNFCRT